MDILLNILFGILGLTIYTLVIARDYILNRKFNLSKWLPAWLWSLAVIVIIAVIMHLEPNAAEAIKTFTGLAIGTDKVAFLTLSIGIIGLTKVAGKSIKSA